MNTGEAEITVDDDWHSLKSALLQSAETVLGRKQTNARNKWFDQDCMQTIKKRSIARRDYLERPTRSKRVTYEDTRRKIKGITRKKKRAYV